MIPRRPRQRSVLDTPSPSVLGVNRPLNHWTYANPGLPCDLCETPMSPERTQTRCTACVDLMYVLTVALTPISAPMAA